MTAWGCRGRCVCVVNGVIVAECPSEGRARGGWAPTCPALAPVANCSLLRRAVETLLDVGVDAVTIVAERQTAPALRSALNDGDHRITWVTCADPPDVVSGLLAAADAVGGDRFVLHTTEGLWLRRREALARAIAEVDADALLFVREAEREPAQAARADGMHALAVATAPASVPVAPEGFHVLGGAVIDALRMVGDGGAQPLLEAVEAVAAAGGRVEATPADGWWRYSGRAEELLEANRIVLDELREEPAPGNTAGNRIEGRVSIHPTATVEGSFLRGPISIGAHATVVDAYVGPYTSVADAATLDNVEIESSIVLTGARLRHIGSRLESCIIGQGASVGRGFDQPRAMRLLVGEDARITLP